ncbi:NAD(P)/FAD-dependent oxidoreductase [Streptomyces paromomycinus]|uniref:Nitrite reductase n=1 Tax=Streptomyces paromomycinus TaxID=92743 RepID=A0A401W9F7_STREY|nr:FAD-dependent oxidoreductase [Streptomyces paromomycinus]GCD45954.1 nitrite reductase [Streptomyces paromomycinus]
MTSQQRVRVVVIGGGMAAARLAQRLRPAGAGGPALTVLGEEPHAPYNRVLLAEVLAGRYAPEVIALPAPHDGVRWLGGVRAVRIDRAARTVLCDDGQAVPYDRLVLATGSNPVLPPLRGLFPPGHDDLPDGVHPFRTLDDCTALAAAAARPGARAVVIGGGLLGVSAARALAERGVPVLLAQQGEHLMERQLDAGAAALLRAHIEALGVEVHTKCRVRGLRVEDGSVRGVELADGYVPDADVVVLACGVRPRTGLARAAGLPVDRGIVVDDELRTADPRIHAIGDCAQHDGVVYGLAGAALEQADLLARLLSEEAAARYRGTRALTRLTLTGPNPGPNSGARPGTNPGPNSGANPGPGSGADSGVYLGPNSGAQSTPLDLAAFGTPSPRPGDDVIRLSDATRSAYRKVIVRGDRLVGGILLGDLGAVGTLARTWEADDPLPDAPLLHLLTTDRPTPDGGS